MNLKKACSIILLSILILFSLSSCSKNENEFKGWQELKYEQKITVPKEVLKKEGKLIIATSPDFSPYEFKDTTKIGDGVFQGADIMLANYLAQTLGLELEIVESNFDGLMTQLTTDKADIVLAGLSYTATRAQNYEFTDVYYLSGDNGGQVLVTLSENLSNYNSFAALNDPNVVIGCQNASIQQELVTFQLPNAKQQIFSQINDAIQLLKKGSINALALSNVNAETVMNAHSDISLITGFKFDDSEYQGNRGLLKKDNLLVEYINEAINMMPSALYEEWLNYNIDYVAALGIGDTSDTNFFVKMWQILADYGLEFLKGTGITLALSAITVFFGTIIAIILQLIRKSRFLVIRSIGNCYVEFVRGIPLLLLLWLLYMIAPNSWPSYVSVGVALFLNSGAYVAEIIRAGILAVDKGQYEAARTLGLSRFKTAKKIIFPQATKKILPALGNEFVALIKETSLASVFFIGDLMTVKNTISSLTYLVIEPFIIVGVIYFVLTFGTTKIIKYLEMKMEA